MVYSSRGGDNGYMKGEDARMPRRGTKKPSRLLMDMRKVYEQEKEEDRTPGQRVLRGMLEKDPEKFIGRLGTMEAAHRSRVGVPAVAGVEKPKESGGENSPPGIVDEGTERVETLIERLLDQANKEAREP